MTELDAPTPDAAQRAVETLLDADVARVEPSRRVRGNPPESFRVHLADGRVVIATCRATATRTAFEAQTLRALRERGAPVPRVHAARGGWMIQEDLGSLRLSQRLDAMSPTDAAPILHAALDALADVHAAGRDAGLDRDAPPLKPPSRYIPMPARLAELAGLSAPTVDADAFAQTLEALPATAFVKRDARPARAVVRHESVLWFDFARCGRGHRVIDLVALLGDEALPEWPALEEELLDAHLARFLETLHVGRAFYSVYGVLYLCRRLARILELAVPQGSDAASAASSPLAERAWWPREECLDADHPLVTEHAFRVLAVRAGRWAERHTLTEPLAPFFVRLATLS
ncbi:MAG: phosphotransferase [Myxococcales bacterium]|nr:phosphotransferase [Myxococcales bacterium]